MQTTSRRTGHRIGSSFTAGLVLLLGGAVPAIAGMLDSPLPTFGDGKPAFRVGLVPVVVKSDQLESHMICTNLDSVAVDIGIEVFDAAGNLLNSVNAGNGVRLDVAVGATVSLATGNTPVLAEDHVITGVLAIAGGSGRIVASSRKVGCVAALVDRLHAVIDPAFGTAPAPALVRVPVWSCGNGVLDPLEECDDGNTTGGDGCESDCTLSATGCGNGTIDAPGETCDPPGSAAGGNGNLCRADCTVCGDGVLDAGEACDDGNGVTGDGCENDCTPTGPFCGDGSVNQPSETCDGTDASACPGQCQPDCSCPVPGLCGNGTLDPGETCETPGSFSCPGGTACSSHCTCPGHFQCYKIRERADVCRDDVAQSCSTDADCAGDGCQTKFPAGQLSPPLEDEFEGPLSAEVSKPRDLCLAVRRDGSSIDDPTLSLMAYRIKSVGPRHTPRFVIYSDSLTAGIKIVETKKEFLLLPPTAFSLSGPASAPTTPFDAYKCYLVRDAKKRCSGDPTIRCKSDAACASAAAGSCYVGFPKGVRVSLTGDPFEDAPKVGVKRPRYFCNPVQQDGSVLLNPNVHYAVYSIKDPEKNHVKRPTGIRTQNLFGPDVLGTIRPELLFVPARKEPPPP
ncbi:MAG: hypothetical protein ACE5FG_13625 [Myxococcota bacterium]